jgi:hypothetical protein
MYQDTDVEKTYAPIDWRLQEKEARLKQAAYAECGQACKPIRQMSRKEIIDQLFSYHAPTPDTISKHAAINQAAKNFAEVISQNCPNGADLDVAIRLIREARMMANAAVALNGLSL